MSNRDWAFMEAKRRASALDDACSIYRRGDDYIVRMAVAAAPANWRRIATFEPDQTQTFNGEE